MRAALSTISAVLAVLLHSNVIALSAEDAHTFGEALGKVDYNRNVLCKDYPMPHLEQVSKDITRLKKQVAPNNLVIWNEAYKKGYRTALMSRPTGYNLISDCNSQEYNAGTLLGVF